MDANTVHTFLTILETGSFASAALRLHVTQSTVSTRIQSLEQELGCRLFDRGRSGAHATPAGMRFRQHAEGIQRAWNQAKLVASLPPNMSETLTVAAPATLWQTVLIPALPLLRRSFPQSVIRGELANPADIAPRLLNGTVDIALHYEPEMAAGLQVRHLFDERLVLVTSEGDADGDDIPYVFVNWGPAFQAAHADEWRGGFAPELVLDIGSLALPYLLATAARAYLPARAIAVPIEQGLFRAVADVPALIQPIYSVISADPTETAVNAVRVIAGSLEQAGEP